MCSLLLPYLIKLQNGEISQHLSDDESNGLQLDEQVSGLSLRQIFDEFVCWVLTNEWSDECVVETESGPKIPPQPPDYYPTWIRFFLERLCWFSQDLCLISSPDPGASVPSGAEPLPGPRPMCLQGSGSCTSPLQLVLNGCIFCAIDETSYGNYGGLSNTCDPGTPCPAPCDAIDMSCSTYQACLANLDQPKFPETCRCDVNFIADLAEQFFDTEPTGACDSDFYTPQTFLPDQNVPINIFEHEAAFIALPFCCLITFEEVDSLESCAKDPKTDPFRYAVARPFCDILLAAIGNKFGPVCPS